jgi:hypothetical protein
MKLILGLLAVFFIILFAVAKTIKEPSIYDDADMDTTEVLEGGNIQKEIDQDSLNKVYPIIQPDTTSLIHFNN